MSMSWGTGRGVLVRLQGRVQFSCGHVDIDRMIFHDDYPNEGYFWGGGVKRGQGRGSVQGEGWVVNSEQ